MEVVLEVGITFRHLEHDDAIKENIEMKLARINQKFQLKISNTSVVVEKRKHVFFSEVVLNAKDIQCFGEAESDKNIYVAIDEAMDRVEVQLKKHKEKIQNRKVKHKE